MSRLSAMAMMLIASCLTLSADSFEGWWKGEVMRLPIVFHITRGDSGELTAIMKSPAQTDREIPCGEVRANADSIHITIPLINGSYRGRMTADSASIEGIFTQGVTIPMSLERTTAEAAQLYRPQEPKPPFPYVSREVTFRNGDITLAGTLTMPVYGFRPGAVVLVTGSGTQNRDEEIMGHKPFAVIADFLTRAGWAVLRYDDRGAGGSDKGKSTDTTLDFAADAMAAVRYLQSLPEINQKRIGILGHSEGGTIALLDAATYPDDVAFAISLAGPSVKGRDLMIRQNEMIYEMSGNAMTDSLRQMVTAMFDDIVSITDTELLKKSIVNRILMDQSKSQDEARTTADVMASPWYTAFVRLDPTPCLPKIKCPVLAVNGEWDVQVDARQNLSNISRYIPQATVKSYPGLNHMFQEAPSKAASLSYGSITQTISPQVLQDIAQWLSTLPD